jgi:uncharacterized membrane protein YphA (DoxX/SURF4 family)
MVSISRTTIAPTRTRAVAYWITTGLVAVELGLGGVWDVLRIPYVRGIVAHVGYPMYFLTILGAWKLAGMVALLLPRLPRLKEWAYAGTFFAFTGAVASHLAVGDGPGAWAYPLVVAGLTVASWALRPPSRRLARLPPHRPS